MRSIFLKSLDLTEHMLQQAQKGLQRYLGFNGDLKVLASVIALVVFSLIRTTIGNPETYTAPVHATIDAKGVAILRYSPSEVEIELKGSADDIRSFDQTQLKVEVKIDSAPKGKIANVTLMRGNIVGAGKLRVGKITPAEIRVEYDQEFEIKMMVKEPELLGKPLQGEASVRLISNEVKVTGPESQLQKLIAKSVLIPTDSIDVTGKTQSFIKRVKVLPPDDSGISQVKPMELEARVDITIVPPTESIYTNAPTPTVTSRIPLTVKATTDELTNAVVVPAEGEQSPVIETPRAEINSESE